MFLKRMPSLRSSRPRLKTIARAKKLSETGVHWLISGDRDGHQIITVDASVGRIESDPTRD
jgi:hypothetical protein